MNEHEKTERAQEQVEAMTGFYIHLAIFVAVMVLLFVIDYMVGRNWWFYWVLFGWGIGVVAHAFAVFGRSPAFIRRWQLRKIHEIKEKM